MPRRGAFRQDEYRHIYNRGLNKQILFHCNKDFQRFLWYIDLAKEKYKDDLGIIAFCLLPNHFHFVLYNKTENSKISKFIGYICASYTKYYHTKYEKGKGCQYFEGRFKSKKIKDEDYLKTCIYYVENNPVKHKLVDKIEDRLFTSNNSKKENYKTNKEILSLDREFNL